MTKRKICDIITKKLREKTGLISGCQREALRMNITICDDQKSELEKIRQIVMEYAEVHSELFIEISCFSNPLDMLDGINKNGVPDIALLDICMPGILGTEIAKELQSKNEDNTDIIFLTTSSDFAVEAFALHVNDYLTKPFTKERLTDTLDRVIEKRKRRLCRCILKEPVAAKRVLGNVQVFCCLCFFNRKRRISAIVFF